MQVPWVGSGPRQNRALSGGEAARKTSLTQPPSVYLTGRCQELVHDAFQPDVCQVLTNPPLRTFLLPNTTLSQ